MNLKGKKFLVTGGAGFIGSHTADALIAAGAKVAIVDNLFTGRRGNIHPKAKFYRANIASPRLAQAFRAFRPEYVYHLAFHVRVPEVTKNPLLHKDSIIGSINLLHTCAQYGVRKVIFSSSGFLYGNTKHLPARETEPVSFVSPYVAAKRTVEHYLETFRALRGLPYVILRYAAVYGPRQVTGAMADYIRKLKAGKRAVMWGDGRKTRDYVYIDDVVRANLLALRVPDHHGSPIFNVGTGRETSLNALYEKIAALLGRSGRPRYLPDRPGEQIRYALSYAKIRRALNWEPRVGLNEGLRKVVLQSSSSRTQ